MQTSTHTITHKDIETFAQIIEADQITMPLVAVYCGSRFGKKALYAKTALELGEKMAEAGFGVVYGGASVGIMGAVADGVLSKQGMAVGVIPRFLLQKELSHEKLTKLHFTDSMHTRKALMAEYASAFVALSGGMGTLEEIAEIFTWRQLELHKKPIIFLNTQGFYDHFIQHIKFMAQEGFMNPEDLQYLIVCNTPDEVVDVLKNHRENVVKNLSSH